jgi:hypothetical protein
VNLGEWEGTAGQPAHMVGTINYESLATFDIRQTDSAVGYIKQHAKDASVAVASALGSTALMQITRAQAQTAPTPPSSTSTN